MIQGPRPTTQNPISKIQDPRSKTQDQRSKIQDLRSKIQNPGPNIQDLPSKDPRPRIQDPTSKIQGPKIQDPNPRSRIQDPGSTNPIINFFIFSFFHFFIFSFFHFLFLPFVPGREIEKNEKMSRDHEKREDAFLLQQLLIPHQNGKIGAIRSIFADFSDASIVETELEGVIFSKKGPP